MASIGISASIEDAAKRFYEALDALQVALERRKANEDQLSQFEDDMHLMALDRARLARELDETLTGLKTRDQIQGEVSQRVERAINRIDMLLQEAS